MSLGETCHLKGRDMVTAWRTVLSCYDCDSTDQRYDATLFEYIVTSHNAWIGYEYSLTNLNRPRAIHEHNPHPLEVMGCVWLQE